MWGPMSEIILPAGTKMRKLYEALSSGRISALDFTVLFVLYHEVDRASAITEISHDKIAATIGCKRRAVERSTARLAAGQAPFIKIERRAIGQRSDGSTVYGGRHGRNSYRLMFKRLPDGAVISNERPSPGTVLKDRPAGHERPSPEIQKDRLPGGNTLSLDLSHKNLPCAHAGESDHGSDPFEVRWQAIKERLARSERFGQAKVASWLDKLSVESVIDGKVMLLAPTRFLAHYNVTNHADIILTEWRALDESVSQVIIEFHPSTK